MNNMSNISLYDIICYMADNKDDKDINLYGHVSISTEAAKELSKGLQTIGSNLGLGAIIAGVAAAVSKTLAKTPLPLIQKLVLC